MADVDPVAKRKLLEVGWQLVCARNCRPFKQYGDHWDKALDLDRVIPAVAKIVEISQRLCADILNDVAEAGLARIERNETGRSDRL